MGKVNPFALLNMKECIKEKLKGQTIRERSANHEGNLFIETDTDSYWLKSGDPFKIKGRWYVREDTLKMFRNSSNKVKHVVFQFPERTNDLHIISFENFMRHARPDNEPDSDGNVLGISIRKLVNWNDYTREQCGNITNYL